VAAAIPPRPNPLTLDDLYAAGVVVGGQRAHRIVCEMPDGGRVVVQLGFREPPVEPGEPGDGGELAPWQLALREALEELAPGETISTQKLADKAGYANTGHLRAELKRLEEAGIVELGKNFGVKRVDTS
jgi:hypothetical protein